MPELKTPHGHIGKIVKLWSEPTPYGNFFAWWLKWDDGSEEVTADTARGHNSFSRRQELRLFRDYLSPELAKELERLEAKRVAHLAPLRGILV